MTFHFHQPSPNRAYWTSSQGSSILKWNLFENDCWNFLDWSGWPSIYKKIILPSFITHCMTNISYSFSVMIKTTQKTLDFQTCLKTSYKNIFGHCNAKPVFDGQKHPWLGCFQSLKMFIIDIFGHWKASFAFKLPKMFTYIVYKHVWSS